METEGKNGSSRRKFSITVKTGPLSDEEKRDWEQLWENDPCSVSEKTLNDEHTYHIREGINRQNWSENATTDDMRSLSNLEEKEREQLWENDFGAISEKALNYEHPDYLEKGLNRANWGSDAADTPHDETLFPDEVISRYGGDGCYFSDIGAEFNSLQLPYSQDKAERHYYEVVKPVRVKQSTVANQAFMKPSSPAQQYKTEQTAKKLLEQGYIVPISEEEAFSKCPTGKTALSEKFEKESLHDALHNQNLFEEKVKGDYNYEETEYGKRVSGSLELKEGKRNAYAQRTVGGIDRKADDDGGHLFGARFGGDPGKQNLEAQNKDLNRGTYKIRENEWADSLEKGDKVFASVESYRSNDSERPDAFMGISVIEHPDGSREWDAFSYQNESSAVQESWNATVAAQDDLYDQYDNPLNYDPSEYNEELSDFDYEYAEDSRSPAKIDSREIENGTGGRDESVSMDEIKPEPEQETEGTESEGEENPQTLGNEKTEDASMDEIEPDPEQETEGTESEDEENPQTLGNDKTEDASMDEIEPDPEQETEGTESEDEENPQAQEDDKSKNVSMDGIKPDSKQEEENTANKDKENPQTQEDDKTENESKERRKTGSEQETEGTENKNEENPQAQEDDKSKNVSMDEIKPDSKQEEENTANKSEENPQTQEDDKTKNVSMDEAKPDSEQKSDQDSPKVKPNDQTNKQDTPPDESNDQNINR